MNENIHVHTYIEEKLYLLVEKYINFLFMKMPNKIDKPYRILENQIFLIYTKAH
jgi:hypothetical protein